MSSFRAIGGVSASLRTLLRDRMEDPVDVSIAPPDVTVSGMSARRLNLYLFQVTENGYVKSQELPGRGHPGAYGHPPLSLDLHYLLTAYGRDEAGADSDLEAQEILGDAMRVLHDLPFVTDRLEITRSAVGTLGDPILDNSLIRAAEQVKISLQLMTLEDLSKIWTALPETNFRRSVAYQVSVVQIESQRPRRFPKPVGEPPAAGPRIFAVPLRGPQISGIRVRRLGDPPGAESRFAYARTGDTLIVEGRNFAGATTRVMLGEVDATDQIGPSRQDDSIEVIVPDDTALQPGPQPVKVVQDVMMGEPPGPRPGFRSNLSVFVLVPRIDDLTLDRDALPNGKMRTLEILGERLFLNTLSGETLVGPALIPKTAYHASQPTKITVLPDTLPAWPVRCLISGDLSSFPSNLPSPLEIEVAIDSDGPRRATLASRPTTLADAARVLQAAIRGATGGGTAFKGARVTTANDRLVVVPGGLGENVTVSVGAVADLLMLTNGTGVTTSQGYLSGELTPFPRLTSGSPAVTLTLGGTTSTVPLDALAAARPGTVPEAAPLLQTDIRSAGFSNVQVATLEDQLLILPGADGNVVFDKVAGADETTVAELQLRARYPVRVRVNGAESIDERGLELP
jgi:hypothetical protein